VTGSCTPGHKRSLISSVPHLKILKLLGVCCDKSREDSTKDVLTSETDTSEMVTVSALQVSSLCIIGTFPQNFIICVIDDQNTKYVFVSNGIHVLYLKLNLQ
jgi:hypothetical protein